MKKAEIYDAMRACLARIQDEAKEAEECCQKAAVACVLNNDSTEGQTTFFNAGRADGLWKAAKEVSQLISEVTNLLNED